MSYRLVRKEGKLSVHFVYPNGVYEQESATIPPSDSVDNMHNHLLALMQSCNSPVMVEGADGKVEPEASVERAKRILSNERRSKPWL